MTHRDITFDIANGRTPRSAITGSQAFRTIVTCVDPQAGAMEIEFLIRWGL